MKKIGYILALFITILTTRVAPAQNTKLENSILWKIEHRSLKKPSYLFGTIHLMCEQDFQMHPKLTKALTSADQLIVEVNLSDPEEMKALQQSILGKQKLSELLTEAQQAKLSALLKKKLNMTLAQVDQYTLTTIYSLFIIQDLLSCTSKKMYEMELMTLASQQKKPVAGLESATIQMDYFNKAYPQDLILSQLDSFDVYKAVFAELVENYKQEKLEDIAAQMSDKRFMDDSTNYWLLTLRNADWAEKLPAMLGQKSSLIAVGTAHLTGKNGLIYLLRKKGYTVTPVFN